MDSTGALALEEVPERLLVIGGGIIGLEMATVYDALGARITVVEMMDQLIPGCDPDLVMPLRKRIAGRYEAILLGTRVSGVEAADDGLRVSFEGDDAPEPRTVDRILVAVGRRANGDRIGADAAGVEVDDRGVIAVDDQLRTNVPHIHAIGDLTGEPMLAHKASHQGVVAAEVIAGHDVAFDVRSIPSVAYTDPEIAWTGLTETAAARDGIEHEVATFPWAASGRALTVGRPEGRTKLIVEPGTRRLLGVGIVGVNAGELIAEAVHALEMGSDAEDLGPDDPPAPDPLRDPDVRGRGGRGHGHRPLGPVEPHRLHALRAAQRERGAAGEPLDHQAVVAHVVGEAGVLGGGVPVEDDQAVDRSGDPRPSWTRCSPPRGRASRAAAGRAGGGRRARRTRRRRPWPPGRRWRSRCPRRTRGRRTGGAARCPPPPGAGSRAGTGTGSCWAAGTGAARPAAGPAAPPAGRTPTGGGAW